MEKAIKQIAEEYIDKTQKEILDELSEIFQIMDGKRVFRRNDDYLMQYFVDEELLKFLDNLKGNNCLYSFTKKGVAVVSIHDQQRMKQQGS